MHFFENQSYYLIQAVFLYDKSISVFRIKLGWRFPRHEALWRRPFFILVNLLNCSICLVSHTNYLAILLLSCMKLIKLEDIINHWKLTINLRVGSKWPITGYIIVNLSLSFFILSVVYVGLFKWENSLYSIKKNHFFC